MIYFIIKKRRETSGSAGFGECWTFWCKYPYEQTSIHSSRMRTTHLLTIWEGGRVYIRGVRIREICPTLGVLSKPGWSASKGGGLPNFGGLHPRGSAQSGRGLHPGGSAQPWRGLHPGGLGRPPPPWTEWLTDRCKNITLLLFNLFYSSLQSNTQMPDLPTLYNYGKDTTRWVRIKDKSNE